MSAQIKGSSTRGERSRLAVKGPPLAAGGGKPREDQAVSSDVVVSGLQQILTLEARFRAAKSAEELGYLAANDVRRLTGTRQSFVLQADGRSRLRVKAVSSLAVVERDAPLIRWIERLVGEMRQHNQGSNEVEFSLPAYSDASCQEVQAYPFKYFLWQPLILSDGTVFAGLLQARERPFSKADKQLTGRLASTLGHSWRALKGDKRLNPNGRKRGLLAAAVFAVLVAAGALPVPMTAIAPIEIVAKDPFVIAAPIDGVIDSVMKEPNARVGEGETLLRFDDTTLRNNALLAEREVKVSEASFHKTRQSAFFSEEARYQLAIASAERALKKAELAYAKELLSKTSVLAPVSGVVIYPDKAELEGKPVATGEEVMQIANPEKVQIEISLPVADAIVLEENAEVRVFLDADPMHALHGRIVKGSYQATAQPSGQLSYELMADFSGEPGEMPRIGARGTAQVFGSETSLAFFLFRRPIAALRQHFGF